MTVQKSVSGTAGLSRAGRGGQIGEQGAGPEEQARLEKTSSRDIHGWDSAGRKLGQTNRSGTSHSSRAGSGGACWRGRPLISDQWVCTIFQAPSIFAKTSVQFQAERWSMDPSGRRLVARNR